MICSSTTTDKAVLYLFICYETAPNSSDSVIKDPFHDLTPPTEYWTWEWPEKRSYRIKKPRHLELFPHLHNVLLPCES